MYIYIYIYMYICCRESIQRLKCDYIDLYQVPTTGLRGNPRLL